ncbi:recombinase family protein [Streptomyces griseorubiginosus]|uniref:recombinase family protein n=1 Tax=Streptomyces griseorubiginosus TaxID=67304 RepID=UPI0036E7A31F
MAEHDTSVRPNAQIERRAHTRPSACEVKLLLEELRGVPRDAPSPSEALELRKAGWHLVVAYCRISNDRHRRDGHGVEDQARHCARIAAQHRMIVIHRYVDNDKSASKIDVRRPEFNSMVAALTAGKTTAGYPIDGVVCVSDDRLYRDVHTFQIFLRCFTAHPARVYADGLGTYDLYSEDAAQRGLLGAAAARAESTKQQHRAKLNHRARAERGEPVASRRTFGWNADMVTLNHGESEVVRRGVQSLLAGKTLTAVTHDFVASGYTTTLGNSWQRQTVKQLLRNPRICGYRKLHGLLIRDTDGKPVVGQWTSIVSPEEWHAVSQMLDKQRHPGGWAKNGPTPVDSGYLLTGLVRCGRPLGNGRRCGAPILGKPTKTAYVYCCRPALDGGCGRVSRQGPAVDDLIVQKVLGMLCGPAGESVLLVRSTLSWPGAHPLDTATRRKAALQERWYAEEISDHEYFSQLKIEETSIKRLMTEQQMWALNRRSDTHEPVDTRARWDALSRSEQRGFLSGLLESVMILPGTKGSHRFDPATVVPVWRGTVSARPTR